MKRYGLIFLLWLCSCTASKQIMSGPEVIRDHPGPIRFLASGFGVQDIACLPCSMLVKATLPLSLKRTMILRSADCTHPRLSGGLKTHGKLSGPGIGCCLDPLALYLACQHLINAFSAVKKYSADLCERNGAVIP